jgi:hypothetical protein
MDTTVAEKEIERERDKKWRIERRRPHFTHFLCIFIALS